MIGGWLARMADYDNIPRNATLVPSRFKVKIPEPQVKDFQDLLRLSKIGPKTYENLREDRKFGITHQWLTEAKAYWETKYSWLVNNLCIPCNTTLISVVGATQKHTSISSRSTKWSSKMTRALLSPSTSLVYSPSTKMLFQSCCYTAGQVYYTLTSGTGSSPYTPHLIPIQAASSSSTRS